MNKLFCILFPIIILISCSENSSVDNRTRIKYYDNGNIFCKRTYNKAGKLDGRSSWFYKNGDLKRTLLFKNGKKDGWEVRYKASGKIECKKLFVEDDLAIEKEYRNGQLAIIISYFIGEKEIVNLIAYNSYGKIIEGFSEYLILTLTVDSTQKSSLEVNYPIFSQDSSVKLDHVDVKVKSSFRKGDTSCLNSFSIFPIHNKLVIPLEQSHYFNGKIGLQLDCYEKHQLGSGIYNIKKVKYLQLEKDKKPNYWGIGGVYRSW